MEAVIVGGLFLFALNGLMLCVSINKTQHATRLLRESKQLSLRLLARRR